MRRSLVLLATAAPSGQAAAKAVPVSVKVAVLVVVFTTSECANAAAYSRRSVWSSLMGWSPVLIVALI